MNFKKYFKYALHHKVKFGLLHFLIPAAAIVIPTVIVVTQVSNFRISSFQFTKPKPIILSQKVLPANIQQAIQNLASQEIKQEQAKANLAISFAEPPQAGILSGAVLSVQEAMTSNPSEKAKIKIKIIDNLITKLPSQTPDQIVETIEEIGKETDEIIRDPQVQADRRVLQLIIEQYNRLQLILQKIEDQLPVEAYLKVEEARQKYLVVTATASINAAPNLDAVHNIALKEVEKVVGEDFAELKAIEIITDFEAGIKPEAKEKLAGLQKQLAVEFEKRMLKLPRDVRERKLQDFIKYSFGNPVRQVQSFERMKGFLGSKEIISGVEDLRKIALQKLKDRFSELNSEEKIQNFLESELKDPKNIETLKNEAKKQVIKLSKEEEQALFEKMQQIVQSIFLSSDNQKSDLEKQLPTDIQNEIQKLKQELSDRNVPKIETPEGIILPEIARLPDEVENAIVAAAKKKIEEENRPKDVELDLTLQAKDLGVTDPIILPGNPLYLIKEALRGLTLVVALDSASRAERLIAQANVRTIEAAKLLERSEDTKTIQLALDTLKGIQEDFNKLKEHADELDQLDETKIDSLVDQIIKNGIARQTVFSAILDKVYGDSYVEVEKIRAEVLKDGVDTLLQLTDNNVQLLTDKLEQAIQEVSGSNLAEIKAIELLTEIKKDQPEEFQPILEDSIDEIAQKLEEELLALPEEERIEKVLDYVDAAPGNPVIQFEAADELKSHFDNPETIALTEGIKDQAVENLTDLISEITDGSSKQEFVDIVVGDQVEDLKIITDIEIRVTPPESGTVVEATPILEAIQDIKAEVEQNIIDHYGNDAQELIQDITPEEGHVTDILDVEVIQEIVEVLDRSPDVSQEVVKEAQKLEDVVIDNFIESVSEEASHALTPVPEVIEQLVELKGETPPSIDAKIDLAIKAEVELIEEHLTSEVNDPQTFENYVAQIEDNPVVEKIVAQVGGAEFTKSLEQTTQEIQATSTEEQTTLVETVKQIEEEIFSSTATSEVEQTLPEPVQEQIEEIKQEVPAEQVPQVIVEATVTVTEPAPTVPAPAPEPAPVVAPAPEAPTVAPPPAAVPTL